MFVTVVPGQASVPLPSERTSVVHGMGVSVGREGPPLPSHHRICGSLRYPLSSASVVRVVEEDYTRVYGSIRGRGEPTNGGLGP